MVATLYGYLPPTLDAVISRPWELVKHVSIPATTSFCVTLICPLIFHSLKKRARATSCANRRDVSLLFGLAKPRRGLVVSLAPLERRLLQRALKTRRCAFPDAIDRPISSR